MSKAISTKPPSGMRDFLAEDVVRRRHVLAIVQRVYESFGFVPLETPTIVQLLVSAGMRFGLQRLIRVIQRQAWCSSFKIVQLSKFQVSQLFNLFHVSKVPIFPTDTSETLQNAPKRSNC